MNTKKIGEYGEKIAASYLKKNGYKIVEKNYRTRSSEIDIIAYDGEVLCFVEVKTRSRTDYGLPCQAVNYRKQQKIINGALYFMSTHNLQSDVRFDVAEVYLNKGITIIPKVNIIKNAFETSGR